MDSVALVADEAIVECAAHALAIRCALPPNPAAPRPFAALLSRRYVPKPGERVGVLVCGGNTDAVDFDRPR